MSKLLFRAVLPRGFSHGTVRSNRPHLNFGSIFQPWAIFSDCHCLIETAHLKQKVPADSLFGFRERTIGDNTPFLSRNNFPLSFQRLGSLELALIGQAFKPGFHMV